MDPSVLRTGNIVHEFKTGHDYPVTGIVNLAGVYLNNNLLFIVHFEDIVPIELTDDLLLRFGYKEGEEDKKENRTFYIQAKESKHIIVKIHKTFYCRDREVKYIHELQNVFYFDTLTGEELKLKLL